MSPAPSLLLRPDHGEGVGKGHVARCHAVAEAWVARGGSATVWSDALHTPWLERFASIGVEVTERAPHGRYDWAVQDGYRITREEANRIRELAGRLLVIDDHGLSGPRGADLLVDQNFGADAAVYPAGTAVLVGPRYALLRGEVTAMRPAAPTVAAEAVRVVYLAGGTPTTSTMRLIAEARVAIERTGLVTVDVHDPRAVAVAMAAADIAVAAAGSTLLELCCLGVPSVLFVVADNQRSGAKAAHHAGVAINAGELDELDSSSVEQLVSGLAHDERARQHLAVAAWTHVDGRGAARVVTRMRSQLLTVRGATSADAARLFEWRNDEVTRLASFSTDRIEWSDHVGWLDRTLSDPDTHLFLVEGDNGEAVGQVRFDVSRDATAEISVGVSPDARGRRLGGAVIDAAVTRLFTDTTVARVLARIKPGNGASIASFLNADFDHAGRGSSGGAEALLYSRSRDAVRA